MYDSIGKLGINTMECATNQAIAYCRPNSEIIALTYLFWILRHEQDALLREGKGGTQANISQTMLKEYSIPLAPLAEQKRIVAQVEALLAQVNASRERLARVPAILKRFRQSVLAAACSGRLTAEWREAQTDLEPASVLLERIRKERKAKLGSKYKEPVAPDTSDLPEVPEAWEWATLEQIAKVELGGTPSRKEASYWEGDVPWISSGEVANCRISESREKITFEGIANSSAKLYPIGTILIAMIGEGKTRGQSAILDIEACTNQNVAGILVDTQNISAEYVWRWALGQYEQNRSGGRGGMQPALNGQKVRAFIVPTPPLKEQAEIVRCVEALFALSDAIEKRVEAARLRAESLTQSILARAFRGELVPTEAELARLEGREYETAEVLLKRINSSLSKNSKLSQQKTLPDLQGSLEYNPMPD